MMQERPSSQKQALIGHLNLLAPEERRQMLEEWNDTAHSIPEATLPDLFAAQVEKTPEAIAVVYGDQRLTYAELNCRTNQLAHYLSDLGVGPEVKVGIHTRRNVSMVISVIAILKAGGVYLPLDADL